MVTVVVVAAVVVAAVVVAAMVVVDGISGSAVAMSLVERGVPSDTISCCCCSCVVSTAIGGTVLVAPMVTSAHSNHYLLDWQRMTSKMCIVSGQERF